VKIEIHDYQDLIRCYQIWLGVAAGLLITIIIGAGMIGAFYGLQKNTWGNTEDVWEGAFSLIASIIITLMGAALLRVSKLQDKWRIKIAKAIESKNQKGTKFGHRFRHFAEKYAMFMLPFITVLREGLEAVVFIGGVGLGLPATSFPLAVMCGLLAGAVIGFLIYKGGNRFALQIFLIVSTCFLYLVAAGLFSKAVGDFERHSVSMSYDYYRVGANEFQVEQDNWWRCC
jgi:high-affinity iron transporter